MNKHDLTGSDIYQQEQKINHRHPALYALCFVFWLGILMSLIKAVS